MEVPTGLKLDAGGWKSLPRNPQIPGLALASSFGMEGSQFGRNRL